MNSCDTTEQQTDTKLSDTDNKSESSEVTDTDQTILVDKPSTDDNESDAKQSHSTPQSTRYQYTKEQLIAISKLSLARTRPLCLDKSFNNASNGLWDPEKWMAYKSPNGSNNSVKCAYTKRERQGNSVSESSGQTKKTNLDPRERLNEEDNDNIILSPQRGSFGTGCHVSTNAKPSGDSRVRDQQEKSKFDETIDHRSNSNQRRVGTGRIIPKERERSNDWLDRDERRFDRYDKDRSFDHNDSRDDYNHSNRRKNNSYSYDNNPKRLSNSRTHKSSRYDNDGYDGYKHNKYEEEPEWLKCGPISKDETMELGGFEDDNRIAKKNSDENADKSNSLSSKKSDWKKESNIKSEKEDEKGGDNLICFGNSSATESQQKQQQFVSTNIENNNKNTNNNGEKTEDFVNDMFKDWFSSVDSEESNKLSSIDNVISCTANNDCDISNKSRFKQWFKESSHASQYRDDHNLNVLTANQGIVKPSPNLSSNRLSFENKSFSAKDSSSNEKDIFDILQSANINVNYLLSHEHNKLDPSKAKSVTELEAGLKHLEVSNGLNELKEESNKSAFDKIMNDLIGKRTTVSYNDKISGVEQPISVTNCLKPNDNFNFSVNANNNAPNSRHQVVNAPTILDLLKEEENKAAFEAISKPSSASFPHQQHQQHHHQQQQQHHQQHVSHNQMNSSNNTIPNWQQSPQSPPMYQSLSMPRIPSPQELSVHTQNILQNALMKRKIEDTILKAQQPSTPDNIHTNASVNKSPINSNYSSFTPTSVIRKMHSEKDKKPMSKTSIPFNELSNELQANASQQSFDLSFVCNKSNNSNIVTPRPILKSNNPPNQSQVNAKQNMNSSAQLYQYSKHDPMFAKLLENDHQKLKMAANIAQQQQQQQRQMNATPMPSFDVRQIAPQFSLSNLQSGGVMISPTTTTPNTNVHMQKSLINNMMQTGLNNSNVRSNPMTQLQQMNQIMALQQQYSTASGDSRHNQYSQNRLIPQMNVQNIFKNSSNVQTNSNSAANQLNSSRILPRFGNQYAQQNTSQNIQYSGALDNPNVPKQELLTSTPSSSLYSLSGLHQNFSNTGNAHSQRNITELFGNEMLVQQRLPDMPSVSLQNALKLEDIERS